MKIIVGLGNPGKEYSETRHNTGFLFLDALSKVLQSEGGSIEWGMKTRFKADIAECKVKGSKIVLLKPYTYMNESGWSVSQYMAWNKVNASKLLLVHDDLDIPLGKFKYNTEKSPKVHYGVMSVEGHLRTKHFLRLRIGVDNRKEGSKIGGVAYVMGKFSEEEKGILSSVFNEVMPEVLAFLTKNNNKKKEEEQ